MPVHEFVVGMTRSGKSYHAQVCALRWPGPAFFYNPQDQEMDLGEWTRVTADDSLSALISLLRQGKARVNFVPHWNTKIANRQLEIVVDEIMRRIWTPDLLMVIDEVDQVAKEGSQGTPAHQIAQRGGKKRVWGLFVTQHPSVVSKTIMRQALRKTIFPCEDSAEYFTKYRWPGEQIEQILSKAPKYSYLQWESRQLTGPFMHK